MKSLKKNRTLSFVLITIVYIIAATGGIILYNSLDLAWWVSLLIADIFATVITFIFSLIFGNASVYDPYWSVQPPVILIALACGRELTALGILLMAAVLFWAIRLTANWAYTFRSLEHQDWRYTMLKEKTGIFYPVINFVGIHTVPTLIVYGVTLPAAFVIIRGIDLAPLSIIFVFISFGAAIMQGLADIEMHSFRKRKSGGFIRDGLWKYSRHPNYLGEILMWWGVAFAVIASAPSLWYLAIGAVANTVLFFTVSIPMADGRQSRKEGFAEYKLQTRMLFPIKKKVFTEEV